MTVREASSIFSVPPEEAWDFIFGDQGRQSLEASKLVTDVENYQMRSDGTRATPW